MKKILLLLTTAVCGCVLLVSCDDKNDDKKVGDGYETLPYEPDKSLAGSVSFFVPYRMDAKAMFDGNPLEEDMLKYSFIYTSKVTDDKLSIHCNTNDDTFGVFIRPIPLSGVPYNTTFDYLCTAARVLYNGIEYTNVSSKVKGWIKLANFDKIALTTRTSPAMLDYLCDITIECDLDGKILQLRITGVNRDPIYME